jgi:hypothetical protein
VFEKRVLRRIFGPKRDDVMGGWRLNYIGIVHLRTGRDSLLNLY